MPPLKLHHRNIIAKARREAGYNQSSLSAELGVTSQAINRIESGTLAPSEELLERLCRALGLECKVVTTVSITRKAGGNVR